MRRKIPDLAQALTGYFDANHVRLARSMLRRLDLVEQALVELDAVIVDACRPWQHHIELLQTIPEWGRRSRKSSSPRTARTYHSSPPALTGLVPAMNESAGKQSPAGKRHGNKRLTAMLVEAAGSVCRMHNKNYLAVEHARPATRHGPSPDRGRTLDPGCSLLDGHARRAVPRLGPDWHERRNNEAHTRKLITQPERLGHTVILDPAA